MCFSICDSFLTLHATLCRYCLQFYYQQPYAKLVSFQVWNSYRTLSVIVDFGTWCISAAFLIDIAPLFTTFTAVLRSSVRYWSANLYTYGCISFGMFEETKTEER